MPERPDHPDHEQLAAFEAGDGDRRERAGVAAHLAGCSSCAEVVASVEQARSHLALLEEPDLPPGLHDRLAAAVEAEAAQTAADRPASRSYRRAARAAAQDDAPVRPTGRAGARPPDPLVPPPRGLGRGRRPPPRRPGRPLPRPVRRRPHHRRRRRRRAEMGQDGRRRRQGPRVQPPGRDLGGDGQRQTGHRPPGQGRPRLRRHRHPRPARPPPPTPRPAPQPAPTQAEGGGTAYRSSAPTPQAGTADLQPCLPAAAAAADPATRPLVPAFYLEGTYKGRPATVLVTTSNGHPGRVDLWVFPRDNCSPPPLATERVR